MHFGAGLRRIELSSVLAEALRYYHIAEKAPRERDEGLEGEDTEVLQERTATCHACYTHDILCIYIYVHIQIFVYIIFGTHFATISVQCRNLSNCQVCVHNHRIIVTCP